MNKATKIIDSTKLKAFMTCPKRYMFEYEFGWAPEGRNKHLIFGSAWHEAMEHLLLHGYNVASVDEAYDKFLTSYRQHYSAIEDNDGDAKGPSNAYQALMEYAVAYSRDNFRVLYTEVAGQVPVNEDGSWMMAFKMDGIIERNGYVQVMEHKTAGRRGFEDSHKTGIQVGLYTHALYGMFPDARVGGLTINETIFYKPNTAAAKTRLRAGGTVNEFERIPIDMNYEKMERWLIMTQYWLTHLYEEKAKMEANDITCFPANGTGCFSYNSKCPYFDFCQAWANPLERRGVIPIGFQEKWWNPLDEYAAGVEKFNAIKELAGSEDVLVSSTENSTPDGQVNGGGK